MTDEKALFAAILAHPFEDTPRLAYADWLDEHGADSPHAAGTSEGGTGEAWGKNSERAEFIRLSVDRASGGDRDGVRHLELYGRAVKAWQAVLTPLRGPECRFHIERGFPNHAVAPADRLIAEGDELFRLAPLTTLNVLGVSDANLPDLMRCPWVGRLRWLNLNARDAPGRTDWAALADAPPRPALEGIWFDGGSLSSGGARKLVAANPFPRLRKFQASELDLSAAAPVLFGTGPFGAIDEIYAHRAALTADGIAAIMDGPAVGNLWKLSVPIGPLPVGVLVRGRRWAGLKDLSAYATDLGNDAMRAFAAAPPSALETADLSMNPFDEDGVEALAASPLMAGLKRLSLRSNPIEPGGAEAIAGTPNSRNLRHLDLMSTDLGPSGARALAASPHLELLESLYAPSVDGESRTLLEQRFGDRVHFPDGDP